MIASLNGRKIVAWAASSLLEFYLRETPDHGVAYVVDSNPELQGRMIAGVPVRSPEALAREPLNETIVVIFAISSSAIQSILRAANGQGRLLGRDVVLYSDLFRDGFAKKFEAALMRPMSDVNLTLAKSFSLVTQLPVHTTLFGNLLFLELLSDVIDCGDPSLAIAEVGCFNGGNALLACHYMMHRRTVPYRLFDSFEGFPEPSAHDPVASRKGDYAIETSYEYVLDRFSLFPHVEIIKGFVPDTFARLEPRERYGLVFFDCDLYEPALATFEYFWERIVPGGYMMVSDYVTPDGGYIGVRRAVEEFFGPRNTPVVEFWENTVGLMRKP